MYTPPAFREDRIETLHALIVAHPLGTIVTAGPSGLVANLVPFTLDARRGDRGVLRAHLARANEQIAELRNADTALVIFQGPESYITPSWYASKAEHGRVVPTWNYVVVQAWGKPEVIDDLAWLRTQIGELTHAHEDARAKPWHVSDAPDDFIASQMKGIVGLEIPIGRIEGKWKTSQNRPAPDREGVVTGLTAEGLSAAMAELVAARGKDHR
jgi:transcriptional regulator